MKHHLLRPLPPTTPLQIIKFSLWLHLLSFFHISPCQSSVPPAPPLPFLSCLPFPPLLSSHLSFPPLTPHLSPPLNSINSASNYLSLLTFRTYHSLSSSSHSLILSTASIQHPTIYLSSDFTHTSPLFVLFSHLSHSLYSINLASHYLPLLSSHTYHSSLPPHIFSSLSASLYHP